MNPFRYERVSDASTAVTMLAQVPAGAFHDSYALSSARAGAALGCLGPTAQPRYNWRKPVAAHTLRLFPGHF